MRLANFSYRGQSRAGLVVGDSVIDVAALSASASRVRTVDDILELDLLDEVRTLTAGSRAGPTKLDDVELLAPVLRPDKILMAAVNYKSHEQEGRTVAPSSPYFFTKFRSCLVGHGADILAARVSKQMDYEAELAVIIGTRGKYIGKDEALEHVAGYTAANDVSFRDLQFPEGWPLKLSRQGQNWVKGKALDRSLPLGPWLVTRDEIPDPNDLAISLSVNGDRRQDQRTSDMIFTVAELVSYASEGATLLPGDVICTGTPAGVAKDTGGAFLRDGDVVEVTIERIGTLRNRVVAEPA